MGTVMSRATLLLAATLLGTTVQGQGLFDGSGPEAWVVNPQTGSMLPVDTGDWLLNYTDSGAQNVPFNSPEQVLINTLAQSSERMTPGQPGISLAGLRTAALSLSDPARRGDVRLWPGSGSFARTIELQAGVSPARLAQGSALLELHINGSLVQSLLLCGSGTAAGCVTGREVREGYRGVRDFIVRDGSYRVIATLKDTGGNELASAEQTLELSSSDPRGFRRDSDGDGIPDLIEREIGLDALRADLDLDADGDGWSDFDEWLREDTLYPQGCDRDEKDCVPRDQDDDGWSDFDEDLRGTRLNDPDPQLPAREGEQVIVDISTGQTQVRGEAYRQRALRYKHRPAARRLYEVERRISGNIRVANEAPVSAWSHLAAQGVDGFRAWALDSLLDVKALNETPQPASAFASELLRINASTDLAANRLPPVRLPAGEGAVLQLFGDAATGTYVYKRYYPRLPDASLQRFFDTDPQWSTSMQWKAALIGWLRAELVVDSGQTPDWPSTRVSAALEQVLSEEARIAGESPVLFNDRVPAGERAWLMALDAALRASGRSLGAVAEDIASALAPGGVLREVADFIDAQAAPGALPAGRMSDVWLAARFADSQQISLDDCLIPAEMLALLDQGSPERQALEDRCPVIYTEADAIAGLLADRARRYRLRTLLFEPVGRLVNDPELLDPQADSDGDGTDNENELLRFPYAQAGGVSRADRDGDGTPDGEDLCPQDPADLCVGLPSEPQLLADSAGRVVEADGAVAAIGVYLDRRVTFPVTASWQALADTGDSATPGVDFEASSGTLHIAPGQQLVLIAIPILGDDISEGDETFRIQISNVSGAQSGVAASGVPVTIVDAGLTRDFTAVASAPESAEERSTVILDGRQSRDTRGNITGYLWQQISGPDVSGSMSGGMTAVAEFTAPQVLALTALEFSLTVTVEDGSTAADTISIDITPVDDPPVLTGQQARFTVEHGAQLRVDDTELFANVDEPDGEPLSLPTVSGTPTGGRLTVDANGFDFAAYGGEKQLSELAASRLTRLANGRVAFVARESGATGIREIIVVYDSVLRTATEVYEVSGDGITGLAGSADRDVLYFQAGSSGPVQQYRPGPGGGLRLNSNATDADFSAGGTLVDPATGDLLYCGTAGVWRRLDAASLEPEAQAESTACSNSFGQSGERIPQTQLGDAFCFADGMTVYCATKGSGVSKVGDFSFVIDDMRAISGLLALQGYDFTDGIVALVQPDGTTDHLRTRPTPVAPRLVDLPGAYLGIAEGDGDRLHLIAIDSTGEEYELVPRTLSFGGFRFDAGGVIADDNRILWFVQKDDQEWVLLEVRLDGAASVPAALGGAVVRATFARPLLGQVPPLPIVRPDGVLVMTRNIDTGRCDWHRVSPANDVRVLLSDIDCSQNAEAGDLLYRRIDPIDFTRRQYAFDGVTVVGDTSVTARIADPGGQFVDLDVTLELKEAAGQGGTAPPLTGATGGTGGTR